MSEERGWVLIDVDFKLAWGNEGRWISPQSGCRLAQGIAVFSTEVVLQLPHWFLKEKAWADEACAKVVLMGRKVDSLADVVPADPRSIRIIVDAALTAEELEGKYGPHGDGEHPDLKRQDWRVRGFGEGASVGYWRWLCSELSVRADEVRAEALRVLASAASSHIASETGDPGFLPVPGEEDRDWIADEEELAIAPAAG